MQQDPVIARDYPHQRSYAPGSSWGLLLLSAYPILDYGIAGRLPTLPDWPQMLWARLDLGGGRTLLIVAAHLMPPQGGLHLDPVEREAVLPSIRAAIDPALADGESLILVGDMSTTEREPAYYDLAHGLQDAQKQAGSGLELTWGLNPQLGWPLPLLRIDYLLSSPDVTPLSLSVDCTPRGSDHIIMHGTFALPSAE